MKKHPLINNTRKANPLPAEKPADLIETFGNPKNILRVQKGKSPATVIQAGVEWFEKEMGLNGPSSPRALNYVRHAITALVMANYQANKKFSYDLVHVQEFLSIPPFRHSVMKHCSHLPEVNQMFDKDQGMYEQLSDRQQIEHVIPVLRALQRLAHDATYRK